jgi:hypothetical protein
LLNTGLEAVSFMNLTRETREEPAIDQSNNPVLLSEIHQPAARQVIP